MANRQSPIATSLTLLSTLLISIPAAASAATLTTIHAFGGSPGDGANPKAGLFVSQSGVLFGTTLYGGNGSCSGGCGTVFSLAPPASAGGAWTEDVFNFSPSTGFGPYGGVVGKGGVLYGTTLGNPGTVFGLTPPTTLGGAWSWMRLDSGVPEMDEPWDTPAIGAGGVLYVTTSVGGPTFDSFGDVVSLTPPTTPGGSWTTTVLCSLNTPETGVVIGSGGVLYGTYSNGVYEVTPPASAGGSWTSTTLYGFTGPPGDGLDTSSGVVIGANGVLYGTTIVGGTGSCTYGSSKSGCGTVYSLTPPATSGGAWTERVLYSFKGGNDGFEPNVVVVGPGGVLYGTTLEGGASDAGTVFSLHPPAAAGDAWTETVLYTFTGGDDGAGPYGGVVLGPGGALYGTTFAAGSSGKGTVFQLTP